LYGFPVLVAGGMFFVGKLRGANKANRKFPFPEEVVTAAECV
jgi:hypothetical protein